MAIPAGFEPAAPRLGIWCSILLSYETINGADKGTRTPDINLGKIALYQLSYIRIPRQVETLWDLLDFSAPTT